MSTRSRGRTCDHASRLLDCAVHVVALRHVELQHHELLLARAQQRPIAAPAQSVRKQPAENGADEGSGGIATGS
eukprot:6179650-Pleurochrysis_carterae.AAC.1